MRDDTDKTRLSYWFPLIENIGINVPKTSIIHYRGTSLIEALDGIKPTGIDDLVNEIQSKILFIGLPFFLRTDYTSGKHDWENTCYVKDAEELVIQKHIFKIVEYSAMADICGLPTDVWVVREYIKTNPLFTAFKNMPINREFRFFVKDQEIIHIQPYWPEHAIASSYKSTSIPNWKDVLKEGNNLSQNDLIKLTELTVNVSKHIAGFWSVDWLKSADDKWYLTDMAEGDASYRYDPPKFII